jgi:hypothetical protein
MSQMVIYLPDVGGKVSVRVDGETLWLTQEQIAELFGRELSEAIWHLRNIFREESLVADAVRANFAQTAADGKTNQTLHLV